MVFDVFGNLYIADMGNNCVRRVDTYGFISTEVGNGINGFAGDGGAATNASLSQTRGVAFDKYAVYLLRMPAIIASAKFILWTPLR